ncbi:hypothetical protein TWF481_008907 [Arthrobotrys musiformis]|uniref:Uncharacterized protein n=1 Tax=Arthrobotrys musiformis TaxID=47236 RepID=A0AAV9W2A0_9PEZI
MVVGADVDVDVDVDTAVVAVVEVVEAVEAVAAGNAGNAGFQEGLKALKPSRWSIADRWLDLIRVVYSQREVIRQYAMDLGTCLGEQLHRRGSID